MTDQVDSKIKPEINLQVIPSNNLGTFFRMTVFLEVLLALYFIPISIIRKQDQFIFIAAAITITALLGVMILTRAWKVKLGVQLFFYALFLETSFILLSGSYEILRGIPFAVIAVSFLFVIQLSCPALSSDVTP